MRDPFRNYDAWLEAPFQRAQADGDAYVDWAEAEGLDPDDEATRQRYEEQREADDDDRAERHAQEKADAAEDRWLDRHG